MTFTDTIARYRADQLPRWKAELARLERDIARAATPDRLERATQLRNLIGPEHD